jgi:hypothetical protein
MSRAAAGTPESSITWTLMPVVHQHSPVPVSSGFLQENTRTKLKKHQKACLGNVTIGFMTADFDYSAIYYKIE